jgi:hypothetical protein
MATAFWGEKCDTLGNGVRIVYIFESMLCICKSDHQMRHVYIHTERHKCIPCRYHCDRDHIQKWKSIKWNSVHTCKQHVSTSEMHGSAMQSSMNQWVFMSYHTECWRWIQIVRRWRVSTADFHGSKCSISKPLAITEQCLDERHWIVKQLNKHTQNFKTKDLQSLCHDL